MLSTNVTGNEMLNSKDTSRSCSVATHWSQVESRVAGGGIMYHHANSDEDRARSWTHSLSVRGGEATRTPITREMGAELACMCEQSKSGSENDTRVAGPPPWLPA